MRSHSLRVERIERKLRPPLGPPQQPTLDEVQLEHCHHVLDALMEHFHIPTDFEDSSHGLLNAIGTATMRIKYSDDKPRLYEIQDDRLDLVRRILEHLK